jgi:catechol 2,3-dioxygenase-like lactoylglutathione lyase family enzyme
MKYATNLGLAALLFFCTASAAEIVIKPVLVGIYVKNYDESVAWYSDNLNFRMTKEVVNSNANLRIAFLDNNSFELEIYADIEPDPSAIPLVRDHFGMPGEGFTKLSLEASDLDALNDALKSRNVEFVVETKKSDRKKGKSWFMVKDPDGNLIQIFGSSP